MTDIKYYVGISFKALFENWPRRIRKVGGNVNIFDYTAQKCAVKKRKKKSGSVCTRKCSKENGMFHGKITSADLFRGNI